MSFFSATAPAEIGLKLFLSPVSSRVVLRTACCSIGIALPVYSTCKAIESKDPNEQQRWLLYWAAYGSFSIAEIWTDKILSWVPIYYHLKLAFLVWLQLPSADGAKQLYMNCLRPFFLRHQAKLDYALGAFYCEATRFVSSHQENFQVAKRLFLNALGAAHQMVMGIMHPVARPSRSNQAIEGPSAETEDSDSESVSNSSPGKED